MTGQDEDLRRTHEALNELAALFWRDGPDLHAVRQAVEVLLRNRTKHGLPLTAAFVPGLGAFPEPGRSSDKRWVVVLTDLGEHYNQEDVSRVIGPFCSEAEANSHLAALRRAHLGARSYVIEVDRPGAGAGEAS